MNRNRDIAYTEQTPYTQHDDHRNRCISRTTKHRSDAVGKSQQKIEQCNGSRLHNSIMYYVRFTVKGCNKHRCGCINHNSDQFCNDDRTENAKPRSFFCTVILLCTKILADKSGQRHRKTGHRQKRKSFDFGIRSTSCHRHFSKCIDICLHKNIRNGDHRILKTGRHTVLYDLPQHLAVKTDFI